MSGATRRDFSKWLAGFVGVATLGHVPALAEDGTDWSALEQELLAAMKPLHEADRHVSNVNDQIEAWRLANPWPEDRSLQKVHDEGYAAMLRRLHPGRVRKIRNEAYDHAMEVCKRIADTPVRNLADIRAKATLAKYENESGPIHRLLIRQLQSI